MTYRDNKHSTKRKKHKATKRKLLSHDEASCGNGWYLEDSDGIECPLCLLELEIPENARTIKCPGCGKKLSVRRGVQYLVKLEPK